MSSITFNGPPTARKNATLYQHATETLRFAREVKGLMEGLDNRDRVDLNSETGTVVTATAQQVNLKHDLAGALVKGSLTSMRGQLINGQLDATLTGDSARARVTYRENETQISVAVENRTGSGYGFHPGTVRVLEDKATGALTLEQEQDFPWKFSYGPSVPESEIRFAASGPTQESEVRAFQQGQAFQKSIENEMSKLKAMDNGPKDLNPEPGVVVAAGLDAKNSDNLVHSHMAGNYPVPTEALLKFDPSSGQIAEFSRGFGNQNIIAYRREGDTQVFERNAFLACDRVEVKDDGSRFQQHFKEAKFTGKARRYESEHQVTTSIASRIFDKRNAISVAGWSAAVGAAVGFLSPSTAILGLSTALLAATATAGVVAASKMRDIELNVGVNRFDGADNGERFKNARKAYDQHVSKHRHYFKCEESGPQGATREKVLQLLNLQDTGWAGENLLILSDNFGSKGEPALVVVSKDFHYPVRLQDEGIELPGGKVVAYSSIRAIADGGH